VALSAASLSAHDCWIEPSSFVGGTGSTGFDRPLGFTLELVPEKNHVLRPRDALPVRLSARLCGSRRPASG